MLLMGIAVGLVFGIVLGGHLSALINAHLRFAALILAAVLLRFGTQWAIGQGVAIADTLRWPLYAAAFGMLVGALWLNRRSPGLLVVMVGVASNAIAMLVNGGWMPVLAPALRAAGLSVTEINPSYHVVLPLDLGAEFLRMAGPLGDVIPFPFPLLPNVVSLGDVLISIGLGWFVFATLRWGDPEPEVGGVSLWSGRTRPPASAADIGGRPVILGGEMGPGLAPPIESAPSSSSVPWEIAPGDVAGLPAAGVGTPVPVVAPPPRPSWLVRARSHPYVRLAKDARFSAFWIGQTTSAFGDKLNQIAIAVLIVARTNSAALSGLVFVAAMLPNLLLGPIAGTLVDRWDHKRVMVASDLIRASLVLALPLVATDFLWAVYPLVFGITTISLFFRPARAAVLPRIVSEGDLMAANSAMWTGETFMEVAGYPLAGLLVGLVGAGATLAFWLDSASYLVSALLIAGLVIPPVLREAGPRVGGAIMTFIGELKDGWRFLRTSPPLFQNTLISVLGQLSAGAVIALTSYFAVELLGHPAEVAGQIPGQAETVAVIEAAIGLGNLVGGIVVGIVGTRLRKGRLVVGGFVLMGIATVVLGLSGSTQLAVVAAMTVGVFNLVWLIPSQTLFGELVPSELMGRVVAMRGSLTFGAMTGAAAAASFVAVAVPVGVVIAILGAVTTLAGVIGAFLPAVRDV